MRTGAVLLLLLPLLASAEIYKWVDERGNIHFGDAPPEQAKTQTITPHIDKQGVQLSQPAAAQQWKENALTPPPPAQTPPTAGSARRSPATDYQNADWCEGVVGDCFSDAQDYICKLRYGEGCQPVYHWKVCLHQSCTDRRLADKCDSPFYFLDRRPAMLGRRDLGRSLPLREWVSDRDWQCLSSHGFFCDEVAFEQHCQDYYRLSCDELKNWVTAAKARCEQSRDGDCRDIDVLIRYRPAPVEEVKKVGTMNASGAVITHDLLMQSLGVSRNDPADYGKLQPALESITGLNIRPSRHWFDCERRWQD